MINDLLELLEQEDLSESQREIAEVTGMEMYRKLIREFGGSDPIYFPNAENVTLSARNRIIKQEFLDGVSPRKLAAKYSLSEQYVRTLIKQLTNQ